MPAKENIISHFFHNNRAVTDLELAAADSIDTFYPPTDDASELLVAVDSRDYLASAISRAVEDCNAHLLNLNVLSLRLPDSDEWLVALRIDHRNAEAVARSLERYGMRVLDVLNKDKEDDNAEALSPYDETARRRAQELLRILSI